MPYRSIFTQFNDDEGAGWNLKSLRKVLVMERKDKPNKDKVKEILLEVKKKGNVLTNDQLGKLLVFILGNATPLKLPDYVRKDYVKVMGFLHNKPLWREFLKWYLLNKSEKEGMARTTMGISAELQCYWQLFMAIRHCCNTSWKHVNYIHLNSAMYLLDRLALVASFWNNHNHVYTTKSTLIEWLLNENSVSFSKYSSVPLLPNLLGGVNQIHDLLYSFLSKYTTTDGQEALKQWIESSKSSEEQYTTYIMIRLVVAGCILYLNTGGEKDIVSAQLNSKWFRENIEFTDMYRTLRKGQRERRVETAISEMLYDLGNPLVMVNNKNNKREKDVRVKVPVPYRAVYVSNKIWKDRDLVFQELLDDPPYWRGKKRKRVSKGLQPDDAVDWDEIREMRLWSKRNRQ